MKILRSLLASDPAVPFVAIDFETADYGADSACAVALVRVEQGCIARRQVALIRPPRRHFRFTHIHGITWNDVAGAPSFADCWPALSDILDGAQFLAAHNSAFDCRVLRACCEQGGLEPPALPFLCTVKVARHTWKLRPANLPAVCAHLRIPLKHHDAGSDAEACARIVLEAHRQLIANNLQVQKADVSRAISQ
jgi:DNA polymerase III subunit epsilon